MANKFDKILGEYRQSDAGTASNGLPVGGTINQKLVKNSDTDYDAKWTDDSSGSSYFNSATVDFGTSITPDNVVLTINDSNITTSKKVIAQVISPDAGRDFDEMEMEQFSVSIGNIINLTSFDIIVSCLSGGANGQYTVNYSF